VPLCSAHIFETIDQDTLTALRFKLPPLTLKFIVRSLLTRDYPIRCRELGEGAYGRVFLVKNKVSLYAYKEFKKDPTGAFLADPSLLQETFIHLVLPKHPSIVQVQAVNCEGMYFSFNYGVSFEEHMKLDSLQHPLICEYLLSIAQALDHLHSHGFIYKDLKPNNIIIQSANPKAQLIDLGMARLEKFDDDNRFCQQITPPETVLASKDSPLTTKCDVWGFGVLIYQALSMGAVPFFPYDGWLPDYPRKVAAFCKNAPCAIDQLVAQLSSRRQRILRARDPFGFLLELTARCLHGDPKQRPSMSEITNSLSIYQQKLK
jgi:serine/threonine protein kinase